MNNLLKIAALLCIMILIISCGGNQTPPPTLAFHFSGDTVHVNRESVLFQRLAFTTATEQPFARQIETPATIAFNPTQQAYVIIPFSGRVTRSHVRLGQTVSAGTPLFELSSADFIEAQADFFQARSEYEVAARAFRRYQELYNNGVAAQRDLEEARMEYEVAQQELLHATAVVRVFHPNPETMTVGDPLIIRSPIAGTVIENEVVLGQFINEEEEVISIANLQAMWLEAHISERDIRFVNNESTIQFRLNAHPDTTMTARVFHISNFVDEETRMINLFAETDNQHHLLRAGMFATAIITGQEQQRITVPETAIMQGERQNFVFVRVSETAFVRRYVDVETLTNGVAVIVSGLEKGEEIISRGSIYILSDGGFFIR